MVSRYTCTRSLPQLCRILQNYPTGSTSKIPLVCSQSIDSRFLCNFAQMAAKTMTVEHDETSKEFFIQLSDPSAKAYLQYDSVEDGVVDLYHTLVPTSHRGQGIAKHLAKAALDHFSNEGTKFKLTCTYLQKYAKDNPNELHKKMIIPENL